MINPREKMIKLAEFFEGVQELPTNRGYATELFQKAVDGVAQGEPYCMGFLQYLKNLVEDAFNVKSEVFESEHCLSVWKHSPPRLKLVRPEVGSWMIFRKGETSQGHAELVISLSATGLGVWTIGANTSREGGDPREGDGVFRRYRSLSGVGNLKVVGFLRVFE